MFSQDKLKTMVGLFVINTLFSLITFSIGTSNFSDSPKTIPFDLGHTVLPDLSDNMWLQALVLLMFNLPMLIGNDFQTQFMQYGILLLLTRHAIGLLTITNPHKYKTCDKTYKIQYSLLGHCYENYFNFSFANAVLIFLLLLDNNFSQLVAISFLGIYTIVLLLLRTGTSVELLFTGLLMYTIKSLGIVNNLPYFMQVNT